MPIIATKSFLSTALATGNAYRLLPPTIGDFQPLNLGSPTPQWLASTRDMNGDGRDDLVIGAPLSDANGLDSGRVVIELAPLSGTTTLGGAGQLVINGGHAGDLAGNAVAGLADLNGDGRGEVLIGAPGVDVGALTDAGAAFVVYGANAGTINLADVFNGIGGYAIKGEAAGDAAGTNLLSIRDMNGDGIADYAIGASGNDQGGTDAGAVYIVWGTSASTGIRLSDVAAGTGGFKIIGAHKGDAVDSIIGTVKDMNGDGIDEIIIGSPDTGSGGSKTGAVYVVFGKASATSISLDAVANGTGGFIINGMVDDKAGSAVSGIGDVNGDGLGDILVAAPRADHAYVVYGKAGGAAVDLANVKNGIGGFEIVAETTGDFNAISITGGTDLNHDGIADIVVGAPDASEAGNTTGAVYVIWGGASSTVFLSAVAQNQGGAKIVGSSDSQTGASVAITGDLNGDGTADLLIGAPGVGESAFAFYTPATWQPDINVFGSALADTIGLGFRSGVHAVGEGSDNVMGLGGNDTIATFGGDDFLDGGVGADAMAGGLGNDSYWVDNAGDAVIENAGEGTDTVNTTISYTLGANVEKLVLSVGGLTGRGNAGNNTIVGSSGADTIDGAAGADAMFGGAGSDTYRVDDAGDAVNEDAGGGTDTVISTISYALGANVENLVLAGSGLVGTGNAANNAITGSAGADTIDGGAGADTMAGGLGDDRYFVDSSADVVTEAAGGGIDTVFASANFTITGDVERLVLSGDARSGTGNAIANTITGTDGNDTLDGGAGADTLVGGLGDDTYRVDSAGDTVVELDGQGTDTAIASFDYTLNDTAIENLTLAGNAHRGTGNAGSNLITGGSGADTLDGAGGVDTLVGGAGDDTFVVDSTTDTLVEAAGGGTDTVLTWVDFALSDGSEIENLTLTGDAHHALGNAGNNALTGAGGADLLEGGLGNDVLDGKLGADTMIGGLGDDTYRIDNPADVVIENAGEGIDTVIVGSDWTLAENIENVTLSGTGHALTGNAGNNSLQGDVGNDILDGADGDDTELGGDGNDVLISASGSDTLAGGSGDDVYRVHGGTAQIEDFQGHDTIDASEAQGNSYIDLSGETQSHVEDHNLNFGHGGTVTGALNVQFLQDLTGSFGDDIANVRLLVPQIVDALQGVSGGAAFGVSSFRDKVFGSFGAGDDWVYRTDLAMGATTGALTSTYNGFIASGGSDEPESQIEALLQLAVRAGGEVGFQSNSARIAVMFTDAHFHTAADGRAAGISVANNGDAIINNGGILENYPELAQVKAALEAANIIPVFAVVAGLEATYQGLVDFLGRGTVVTLTADSSNIVTAITTGLTTATTTHISDAVGGAGNDVLIGNFGDNVLTGNAGDDHLKGASGNDGLHGGDGDDTAEYSGAITDYAVTRNADGSISVVDHRTGINDGIDTLDGVEHLLVGGALYTVDEAIAATAPRPNTAPVLSGAQAVLAAGAEDVAYTVSAADLLAGFSDAEGDALVVTGLAADHGTVTANADGSFTITPAANYNGPELLSYTVSDGLGGTLAASLGFDLAPSPDAASFGGATGGAVAEDGTLVASGTLTVSDPDTGETGFAAPPAEALQGLYGSFTFDAASGGWTYTLDNALPATQALGLGDVVSETLTVASLDGTTQTITVSVAGAYDGPVISGDTTGSVIEDGAGTGGTLAITNATFAEPDAASLAGTYGTFAFDAASSAWTYSIDNGLAATQALSAGQSVTETLVVAAADGSISQAITVTVNGANDAATIGGSATGALTEDDPAIVGGTLTVADADGGEAGFAAPASLSGIYGAFSFDVATGAWTYALDNTRAATQGLAQGQAATDMLTIHSIDGTASQVIGVVVTGANDVAVIGGASTGNVIEAGSGGTGVALAAGFLSISDADAGQRGFAAPASLAGTYGTFSFNPATGAWSYALDNARAATQALAAGQVASESLTVTSLDGTASQVLAVTVTGANDAAVIGGTTSGTVVESAIAGGVSQASGVLSISDVDSAAQFAAGSFAGSYGSVAIAVDGSWTYTLNNANAQVDALLTGETLNDAVVVRAADGTTQTLTFTINGVTDTRSATAGNDLLNGTAGNDTLSGLAGDDTLNGGAGDDVLDGGAGSDIIDGGAGIDTVSYASATGSVSVNLSLAGNQNTGNQGKDSILNVENLNGSAFADVLIGSAGANAINGGGGTDKITGGLGADMLWGGAAADTFIYASLAESRSGARDTILDFEGGNAAGGDLIDLSQIDAMAGTNRNDAFSFIGQAAFHNVAGELRFDTRTPGVTVVQGDTNGDGLADFELVLQWTDLAHPILLGAGDFAL